MLCRPYNPADFDALYALEEACFLPPFRFTRGYMRSLVRARNSAVRVAEVGSALQGFGIVTWARHRGGVAAYIETLEVAPSTRGQGLGRALLGALESAARHAGALAVGLHVDALNAAAIRLYESAGYACQGRKDNFYPQGRAALVYTRDLGPEPLPEVRS